VIETINSYRDSVVECADSATTQQKINTFKLQKDNVEHHEMFAAIPSNHCILVNNESRIKLRIKMVAIYMRMGT